MKRFLKSILGLFLMVNVCFMAAIPSNATSLNRIDNFNNEYLDKYVTWNNISFSYQIKKDAIYSLNKNQYEYLLSCIESTNAQLKYIDRNSDEYEIVIPNTQSDLVSTCLKATKKKFHEGVTKVDVHWWGLTIYLSRSTIKQAGAGVSLAGLFIPEPIVSKVCAACGIVYSQCPGGIAFDYSFAKAGISAFSGTGVITYKAIENIRWQ